jgi:hypothetical protein
MSLETRSPPFEVDGCSPAKVGPVADRGDLDFTYSLTDRVFRFSMGELADFSCAKYDGDFSLSLEQAQRREQGVLRT